MLRLPYRFRKIEEKQSVIPHIGGLRYYLDSYLENFYIRQASIPQSGIYTGPKRQEQSIISLTSFPGRIEACCYAIKSLMIQTYQADKIVLWLSSEQFRATSLPEGMKPLIDAGLEIRYCDDLRSHKKYFYALQEQNVHELIITFDDDIIYEKDAIEKLINKHLQFPDAIVCNRGHHIRMNGDRLMPYNKWELLFEDGVDKPAMAVMPSTGAGCLYPYGCMPKSTFDLELIRQNAWTADDIWMRFNSINNHVKVVRTRKNVATLCNVADSQKEALRIQNDVQGENQKTVDRLLKLFPNTEMILSNE